MRHRLFFVHRLVVILAICSSPFIWWYARHQWYAAQFDILNASSLSPTTSTLSTDETQILNAIPPSHDTITTSLHSPLPTGEQSPLSHSFSSPPVLPSLSQPSPSCPSRLPCPSSYFPNKSRDELTKIQRHMRFFDHPPVNMEGAMSAPCIYAKHAKLLDMDGLQMMIKAETIVRMAPDATTLSITFNPAATGLWSIDGKTLQPHRWELLQELAVLDHNGVWVVTNHALHIMSTQPLHVKWPTVLLPRVIVYKTTPSTTTTVTRTSVGDKISVEDVPVKTMSSPPLVTATSGPEWKDDDDANLDKSRDDIAGIFITWDMVTNQGSIPETFNYFAPGWVWWPYNMQIHSNHELYEHMLLRNFNKVNHRDHDDDNGDNLEDDEEQEEVDINVYVEGSSGTWERHWPIHELRQFYEESTRFFEKRANGWRPPPAPSMHSISHYNRSLSRLRHISYHKAWSAFHNIVAHAKPIV